MKARKAVEAIIEDMTHRLVYSQAWENTDELVKEEIIQKWTSLIESHIQCACFDE